jgi:two-component system chemotaxis sensor kinase CheA
MEIDLSEYLDEFIKEIKNLFQTFETDLELLQSGEYTDDTINEIFRAAHSIKGMSATMEFNNLEKLTHKVEDMFDKIRSKELSINDNIIQTLLVSYNIMTSLVESIQISATEDDVDEKMVLECISKINKIMGIGDKNITSNESNENKIDKFENFKTILNEEYKDEKNIFFTKIVINENSPLASARAFMILTSLKDKEHFINSIPSLETFTNGNNELDENTIYILFSSDKTIDNLKKYLANFPEVEKVFIKNINTQNISFDFKETTSKEEVKEDTQKENLKKEFIIKTFSDLIKYIDETELLLVEQDIENIPNILVDLQNNLLKIHDFLANYNNENISYFTDISNKLNTLFIILQEKEFEFADLYLDKIFKYFNYIRKVESDISLLENNIFIDTLNEFIKEIDRKIAEQKSNSEKRIGEILQEQYKLSQDDISDLLSKQRTKYKGKKIGEIAVAEKKISNQDLIHALKIQKKSKESKKEIVQDMIKIPALKADKLIDLLEELMMIQSQIEQNAIKLLDKDSYLIKDIYKSFRITKDIQNLSISFRMITLHSIFQKVSLNAHDAMRKLKKKVKLEISGENTTIDRIIGSKIVDPLLHLIKNSISHGIEEKEERIAKGKNEIGTIFLNAYSEKGYVYISITDDGQGINPDKVYQKALEKKLIDPNKKYTEDEIINFIFLPGFSTADKVNQIAGRGVGMDVVKTEILKLRGKIKMINRLGQGLSIQLRIPQNMTSLNGTIVNIKSHKYIIPSVFIKEVFKIEDENYVYLGGKKDFVRLRDEIIPVINSDRFFDGEGKAKIMVVLDVDGKYKALPVDEVLDRREIVVKPLSNDFDGIKYILGASILGDGKAALIIGIESLFKLSEKI